MAGKREGGGEGTESSPGKHTDNPLLIRLIRNINYFLICRKDDACEREGAINQVGRNLSR